LSLAGCVSSTGIVKISDDTFMLGAQDPNTRSSSDVKVALYKEANAFCQKDGKKFIQLSNVGEDFKPGSSASAEIQFKCQ